MTKTIYPKAAVVLIGLGVAAASVAQPVAIGRSSLTLPNAERWEVSNVVIDNPKFSGETSGEIPIEAKRLLLKSEDGLTKAVFVSRVSKSGIGGVLMTYTNGCASIKDGPSLYKNDQARRGEVDCLLVASIAQTQSFLNVMPELKKNLNGAAPHTGGAYYIQFSKTLGAGGQATTEVVLANDFKGVADVALTHSTQIPTKVLVWAEEMARANRNAVTSLTGNWALPQLLFE
jgi:hypothetical protein